VLSIRSTKARDLARREKRSVTEIVERALDLYAVRVAGRQPAASFYARMSRICGTGIDLETVIREDRRMHPGSDL
jgi:hypothetical protein